MLGVHEKSRYILLVSYEPTDIFTYFDVQNLHGLSKQECLSYKNTTKNAYIAGFCNLSPKTNKPFVFINLTRCCIDDIRTTGLVMHETMHLAGILYNGDWNNREEEMISFAQNEAYLITDLIKSWYLKKKKKKEHGIK